MLVTLKYNYSRLIYLLRTLSLTYYVNHACQIIPYRNSFNNANMTLKNKLRSYLISSGTRNTGIQKPGYCIKNNTRNR